MFHFDALESFFILGLFAQSLGNSLVPCNHVFVRCQREALSRQDLWKDFTRVMIFDVPFLHGFTQETGVFFRAQQHLNGLPHDPS
jgi:hypothetical protein